MAAEKKLHLEQMAEGLMLAAVLVRGDLAEMAKTPLRASSHSKPVPNYHDALQATRTIKHAQLTHARTQWVELAMAVWEKWAEVNAKKLADISDAASQVPLDQVEGVDLDTLEGYLNPDWARGRNPYLYRLLQVLSRFQKGPGTPNRARMQGLILARSSCDRYGDPHRDELLRDLLLKRYGVED